MASPENILEQFGQAVRKRRLALKISQEELADRAGLHRTYISDIERGARNVSFLNIIEISRALEVAPSTLLREVEEA